MQMQNTKETSRIAMEGKNICFSYGDTPVIWDLDFQIKKGKITTVIGANGCGKSTLFQLLTKSLIPKSGQIFLYGRDVKTIHPREFAKRVAIVHQYHSAPDDMTVEQLVSLGRTPFLHCGCRNKKDDEIIQWAMEVTEVKGFAHREISRLSGGQRQRVWIALSLAQNTNILLLDEPTTYLDIRYQIEILELIRRLNKEYGMTIVMVLHDLNQAIHYSDEVIGLKDGTVAMKGNPNQVITQESLQEIYGIRLRVTQVGEELCVLLPERNRDDKKKTHRTVV